MFAARAFFSFVRLTDPAQYRAYNEWHQLDHRPENLLLPGVAWGERWALTGDCAALTDAPASEYANLDFMAMYWFREPVDESVAAWQELAERSFQWGRRPEAAYVERPLVAFFMPVKGYVAPRVLVSADALPLRPNRGISLRMTKLSEPFSPESERHFTWEDQVAMPELLRLPGVAGGWTFSFLGAQTNPTVPRRDSDLGRGQLRLRLLYLDDDPVATQARIEELESDWQEQAGEQLMISTPARAINPWLDWDRQ